MILLNPHHEAIKFFMPTRPGVAWQVMIDSGNPEKAEMAIIKPGEPYELMSRSTAVLRELTD